MLPSCRYHTQRAYKSAIEQHLKPGLGQYRLRSLTPAALQDFINAKAATGLKQNTILQILTVLTGSLRYAVIPAQLLSSSPALYVRGPKLPAERKASKEETLTPEEFSRILSQYPKGDPGRYALLLGFRAGLRAGEIYGLTWQDVDLSEGFLNVGRIVYRRGPGLLCFGDTKTDKSARRIRIGGTLVQELREYRAAQLRNRVEYGPYYFTQYKQPLKDEKGNAITALTEKPRAEAPALEAADMILRREDGRYRNPDSRHYLAKKISDQLGRPFHFHLLRHSHATLLIESGVSPVAVQARLGHEQVTTTLRTYVHVTESMDREAVSLFEAAVSTS